MQGRLASRKTFLRRLECLHDMYRYYGLLRDNSNFSPFTLLLEALLSDCSVCKYLHSPFPIAADFILLVYSLFIQYTHLIHIVTQKCGSMLVGIIHVCFKLKPTKKTRMLCLLTIKCINHAHIYFYGDHCGSHLSKYQLALSLVY